MHLFQTYLKHPEKHIAFLNDRYTNGVLYKHAFIIGPLVAAKTGHNTASVSTEHQNSLYLNV